MDGNGREGSKADREPAGTRFRRQIGGLSTDVRRPADGREGGRKATGEPKSGDGLDSEDRQGVLSTEVRRLADRQAECINQADYL